MDAKRPLSFRVAASDLAAIDQLAQQHHLTRTSFLVKAALGQLGSVGLDSRVDALEQRVERLEALQRLSG